MGRYIDDGLGGRGRATRLVMTAGARRITSPPESVAELAEGEALVCVVHNAGGRKASQGAEWEGAHFVEDDYELRRHREDATGRYKEWLVVDRAFAERTARR